MHASHRITRMRISHVRILIREIYATLTGKYVPHELLVFAAVLFIGSEEVDRLKKKDDVTVEDVATGFDFGREFLRERLSNWLGAYPTNIQVCAVL
jgi:hypothetical protein